MDRTVTEPQRKTPVVGEADVVIVGGGPAGLAAAIASARVGASTVLIEQFGYLGGTATASLMANINGFRNQVEPDSTQTVRGIAEEIVLKLRDMDGLGKSPYKQKDYPTLPGQLAYSYAVDSEKFKYLTMKMCVDAGVVLMLHSFFSMPVMEGERVTGVVVENKSGRQAVMGKIVIDASGDGDVAARAGCDYWQVHHDEDKRLGDGMMYRIGFGRTRPDAPYACDFGNTSIVWGPGAALIDGTDAAELSQAEVDTRLAVFEDFAKKQESNPALADAKVVETPPLLGIRQTRFIEGEYKLTAEDALEGHRFDDVIAISSCPVIHYYGYRRYLEHEGYDIPYRCLVPKKVDGLLIAGRCISSEQQPYESHRAMVPIMAIGQAAGVAAALCAGSNVQPRSLEAKKVQSVLIGQGAELRK